MWVQYGNWNWISDYDFRGFRLGARADRDRVDVEPIYYPSFMLLRWFLNNVVIGTGDCPLVADANREEMSIVQTEIS